MPFVSVNPTTGETLETYASLSPEALDRALASASSAFAHWRRWSLSERAVVMTRAAELLEGEVPVVAEQMHARDGQDLRRRKG
jgi:acyl-CoA reductase-like NAD-dependent aldehyde dehydrogenase